MNPVIFKMPVLVLNPHNRCNCRCVMCDIWKRDTVQEITPEQLQEQLDSIGRLGVEWVVLTGGEPLMHPSLFRLCELLHSRAIRITLLSSGLLLERYAEQIALHVDDVIVSLDGPEAVHDRIRRVEGAYARIRAGATKLRTLRPGFRIAARCTVQRDNAPHLLDIVHAARELALNSVSFLAADLTSDAFDHGSRAVFNIEPDPEKLGDQIEKLIATGECGGFILESPAKLRRIVTHYRRPEAPVCNAPWVSVVVEADGTVRPCFFHRAIGRVTTTNTLFDVINGPEAIAFRTQLDIPTDPTCRNCVCSLNWK